MQKGEPRKFSHTETYRTETISVKCPISHLSGVKFSPRMVELLASNGIKITSYKHEN